MIAERIGWEHSLTILKDKIRVVRPLYVVWILLTAEPPNPTCYLDLYQPLLLCCPLSDSDDF